MKTTGRGKYWDLASSLRSNILEGIYAPGNRLPNRSELVDEYGVSMATVQKALDELMNDGFVESRSRAGTFVVDHPPHLCNYGIVTPRANQWSLFYPVLRNAVAHAQGGDKLRFSEYQTSHEIEGLAAFERLNSDVLERRMGGLIIVGPSLSLKGSPAMEDPAMPRVFLQTHDIEVHPEVKFNLDSFLERAIEYLRARGRKRIAHLCIDYPWYMYGDRFENSLRQHGIEVNPYWIQSVPIGTIFRGAKNLVNLLMQLEGDKKPDAIIIHDDNLVDHAVAGLLAAGVKVPDEIDVVVMSNFPSQFPSVMPLVRLGFDCREALDKCLHILEMQRNGEQTPDLTQCRARFEHEIEDELL